MIRCNSEADSKVWMKEGIMFIGLVSPDFLLGFFYISGANFDSLKLILSYIQLPLRINKEGI